MGSARRACGCPMGRERCGIWIGDRAVRSEQRDPETLNGAADSGGSPSPHFPARLSWRCSDARRWVRPDCGVLPCPVAREAAGEALAELSRGKGLGSPSLSLTAQGCAALGMRTRRNREALQYHVSAFHIFSQFALCELPIGICTLSSRPRSLKCGFVLFKTKQKSTQVEKCKTWTPVLQMRGRGTTRTNSYFENENITSF